MIADTEGQHREADDLQAGGAHRPAQLYQLKPEFRDELRLLEHGIGQVFAYNLVLNDIGALQFLGCHGTQANQARRVPALP